MTTRDFSHELRRADALLPRLIYAGLGVTFLAMGIIGIFLPLLPTTPFLLLAAACFARASCRMHHWLLNHAVFGSIVLEWRQHHAIPWRAKRFGLLLMAASMTASIVFLLTDWRVALAVFGVALSLLLWRVPSRDAPGDQGTVPFEKIKS